MTTSNASSEHLRFTPEEMALLERFTELMSGPDSGLTFAGLVSELMKLANRDVVLSMLARQVAIEGLIIDEVPLFRGELNDGIRETTGIYIHNLTVDYNPDKVTLFRIISANLKIGPGEAFANEAELFAFIEEVQSKIGQEIEESDESKE